MNILYFKGQYSLPQSTITIPPIPDLPSFLTDGDYKVEAKLSQSGMELGCLEIQLSLKKG